MSWYPFGKYQCRSRPEHINSGRAHANAIAKGAIALAYLGEKERAKQWASRGLTIEPDDPMDQYNIACAFAQMNEPEQALDLLEACLAELIPEFIHGAKHDGDLIPLHDHPRYRALIARADARLAAHQAKGIDDG